MSHHGQIDAAREEHENKVVAYDAAEADYEGQLIQLASRDKEFIQPMVFLLQEQLNYFKVVSLSCGPFRWLFALQLDAIVPLTTSWRRN